MSDDRTPLRIEREVRILAKFDGDKIEGDGKEPVEVLIADVTNGALIPLAHWRNTDGTPPPRIEEYQ